MNELVITVIFLAAVMIVIEVVSIVTRLLMNSGEELPLLNPVIVAAPGDDIRMILEGTAKQLRWNSDVHIGTVIIVCDETEGELYRLCEDFCSEHSGFELCSGDELKKNLYRLQKKEGK